MHFKGILQTYCGTFWITFCTKKLILRCYGAFKLQVKITDRQQNARTQNQETLCGGSGYLNGRGPPDAAE